MVDTDTATAAMQKLAGEASEWFQRVERGEETIVTLKDGRPDWLQELVYTAHGDFGPDDWRYQAIEAAIDAIHDASEDADRSEIGHDFADSHVDVYTGARLAWLASNLNRPGYVDEACE